MKLAGGKLILNSFGPVPLARPIALFYVVVKEKSSIDGEDNHLYGSIFINILNECG